VSLFEDEEEDVDDDDDVVDDDFVDVTNDDLNDGEKPSTEVAAIANERTSPEIFMMRYNSYRIEWE